jgi:hypothetical protein
MKLIHRSIRVSIALDKALADLAKERQISRYALLHQCIRAGLAVLSGEVGASQIPDELVHELGTMGARLAHTERLAERTLYVACAAYVYARSAAGPRTDETQLTADINAAFQRQLSLSGDQS